MRPFDWFLLIGGALMLVFLSATVPAYAVCWPCNTTIWQLTYQGNVINLGDMTEQECNDILAEIDPQTPAFADLECVEVPVVRRDI